MLELGVRDLDQRRLRAIGDAEPRFLDHSLLIAPDYPCTWPSYPFPRFQLTHERVIGPDSPYNIDVPYGRYDIWQPAPAR